MRHVPVPCWYEHARTVSILLLTFMLAIFVSFRFQFRRRIIRGSETKFGSEPQNWYERSGEGLAICISESDAVIHSGWNGGG
jgi:hypothetical protein